MDFNDVFQFNMQVLYIALSIVAFIDYAHRGGAPRRDFFLFVFTLGFPLSITFLRRFMPLESNLLNLVGAYALFSQPYFLFRLLQYARRSQPKIGALILVGVLLCCTLPLSGMTSDRVTIIFSFCAAAEAYVTWGFYQRKRETSGTLRNRLTIITISSGVFTIAFMINAIKAQFPSLGLTPIAQVAAAVSAVLFYIAFIPPRWLRRAWQMEELRGYMSQAKTPAAHDNFVIENLQRLSQSAQKITNGLAAGVLKMDHLSPGRPILTATDQTILARLSALNPSFIEQVWDSQTPSYYFVSNIADSDQRQQLKTLGAQTWILVPIQSQDHFQGLLIVALRGRSLFIDDDLDILKLLTQECVLILDNHRLIGELQASLNQLKQNVDERQRIARELHDAVTQTLFSATITAEGLSKSWQRDPSRAMEQANLIVKLNRAVMAELRILLHELRPETLLRAPLSKLLEQLIDAAKGRKEMEAGIVVEGTENEMPSDVRIVFFRIAQECVNNIVKHSEATMCTIHLQIGSQNAQLQIHDNGKGFNPQVAGDGFGLEIMQEQAGSIGATLSIQSQPYHGTTVSVIWKNEHQVAA